MKNFICGLVFGVGIGMLLAGQILYAQWDPVNPVQSTEVYPELWQQDPPMTTPMLSTDAWRSGLSNPCSR